MIMEARGREKSGGEGGGEERQSLLIIKYYCFASAERVHIFLSEISISSGTICLSSHCQPHSLRRRQGLVQGQRASSWDIGLDQSEKEKRGS